MSLEALCGGSPCLEARLCLRTRNKLDADVAETGIQALEQVGQLRNISEPDRKIAQGLHQLTIDTLDALADTRDAFEERLAVCRTCVGQTACKLEASSMDNDIESNG